MCTTAQHGHAAHATDMHMSLGVGCGVTTAHGRGGLPTRNFFGGGFSSARLEVVFFFAKLALTPAHFEVFHFEPGLSRADTSELDSNPSLAREGHCGHKVAAQLERPMHALMYDMQWSQRRWRLYEQFMRDSAWHL